MQTIRPSFRLKRAFENVPSRRAFGLALALALSLGIIGCSSASPTEPEPTAVAASSVQQTDRQQSQATAAPLQPETGPQEQGQAPSQEQVEDAATVAAPGVTVVPEPTESIATRSEPEESVNEEPQASATPEPLPTSVPTTVAPEITEVPTATPEPEPASGGGGFVIGEGSKATFTVNETLAWLDLPIDAVMHTSGLSGNIYLDGRPSVIDLDLHSMTSDSDRRDGYVKRRMFPDHRTATFTVADLGDVPDPLPEGEVITREVQGEIDIRGVTKPILFQIEARLDPGKLFVVGRTTFTWDELEIPPPNIPGRIQVKDEVRVEVLLAATPDEG